MQIPRRGRDRDLFFADQFTSLWAEVAALRALLPYLPTIIKPALGTGLTMKAVLTRLQPITLNPATAALGITAAAKITLVQPIKLNPPTAAFGLTMKVTLYHHV